MNPGDIVPKGNRKEHSDSTSLLIDGCKPSLLITHHKIVILLWVGKKVMTFRHIGWCTFQESWHNHVKREDGRRVNFFMCKKYVCVTIVRRALSLVELCGISLVTLTPPTNRHAGEWQPEKPKNDVSYPTNPRNIQVFLIRRHLKMLFVSTFQKIMMHMRKMFHKTRDCFSVSSSTFRSWRILFAIIPYSYYVTTRK